MDEFDFNINFGRHPLGMGGAVESRRHVISLAAAMLIGGGISAGGSYLASRSASKASSKTRKMMKALYAEESRRREVLRQMRSQTGTPLPRMRNRKSAGQPVLSRMWAFAGSIGGGSKGDCHGGEARPADRCGLRIGRS